MLRRGHNVAVVVELELEGTKPIRRRFFNRRTQQVRASEKIEPSVLLTDRDLRLFDSALHRAWPIDNKPSFAELLQAIDEADNALSGKSAEVELPSPDEGSASG